MKEIRNSQKKLLIRLSAVLVVMVAFSRFSVGDEKNLVGVKASTMWEEVDLTSVFSRNETLDDNLRLNEDRGTEDVLISIDVSEVAEGLPGYVQIDTADETTAGDVESPDPEKGPLFTPTPVPTPELPQAGEQGAETEDPEATPTPTPTVITPTPTPAYGETLCVTDQRFYDAEAVKNAGRLAGYTRDERYTLLTGIGADTYTTANKAPGYESKTAAAEHMVTIDVPVWIIKGSGSKATSHMTVTVNRELADSVRCIFSDIYMLKEKFPVNEIVSFEYRRVTGSGLGSFSIMSDHSFGAALQINPGDYDNDLYLGSGNDLRDKNGKYYIPKKVIEIFERYGWYWGGKAEAVTATSYFTYLGIDGLKYDGEPPYPVLSKDAKDMKPEYILNLTSRLYSLGYMNTVGIVFDDTAETALKAFQKANGLKQSGKTDVQTWILLVNQTHYMSYAF